MIEMMTKPSDITHEFVEDKADILMDGGVGPHERAGSRQERKCVQVILVRPEIHGPGDRIKACFMETGHGSGHMRGRGDQDKPFNAVPAEDLPGIDGVFSGIFGCGIDHDPLNGNAELRYKVSGQEGRLTCLLIEQVSAPSADDQETIRESPGQQDPLDDPVRARFQFDASLA